MSSHAIPWFLQLLKFAWLASLCEGASWCQAKPGSCLGSRQSYKEPIEIQLVHDVSQIDRMVKFLDWDGDGDLDFVATYWDDNDYKKRRFHLGFFERQNDIFKMHNLLEEYIEEATDTADANPDNVLDFEVTDWDGDGEEDLVLAKYVKTSDRDTDLFLSWANRTTAMSNGEVSPITLILKKPVDGHMVIPFVSLFQAKWCMRAVDWDLDKDTDLLFRSRYFERVDPDTVVERVGDQNPLSNVTIMDILDCQLWHVGDEDGDGYLEMVTSGLTQRMEGQISVSGSIIQRFDDKSRSSLRHFRRTMDGTFVEQIQHPFQNLWVEYIPDLFLAGQKLVFVADWNSDGLPDLLTWYGKSGNPKARVTWYERTEDKDISEDYHTVPYDNINIDCSSVRLEPCRSESPLPGADGQNP